MSDTVKIVRMLVVGGLVAIAIISVALERGCEARFRSEVALARECVETSRHLESGDSFSCPPNTHAVRYSDREGTVITCSCAPR